MLDLSTPKGLHMKERLERELIMWLSTVRPNGRPHLVPVGFLWDGETILVFSEPKTQKVRNLRHSPYAMLSLEAANEGRDLVVIEAKATLLPEGTVAATLPAYADKYQELMASLGTTVEEIARSYTQAIRFAPLRFL